MIFNKQIRNILVIGGNAAGPAAAAKAKRIDPIANVIMFEAGEFISTGTCELPYVLSNVINGYEKIVFFTSEQFESEKGVKVYTKHRVEKINRNQKIISVRNLFSNHLIDFSYDKLVIATGSRAKRIESLTQNQSNVFTFKNVNDLISIQKFIANKKAKKVLIIGAGYIGLELAESFRAINLEVIMADKELLPMPKAKIEIRRRIFDLLSLNGIEFYGGTKSLKTFSFDDQIKSIELDGWRKEIDLVVQAIGFEPNVDLAVAAKLEIGSQGGIKIDSRARTSDANIFAAGDCVELINGIIIRPEFLPLATLAREIGYTAGENSAGGNSIIKPVIKNISVKIFHYIFSSVGLSLDEAANNKFRVSSVSAEANNLVKVMPGSLNTYGTIIYEIGSERILGASFWGGKEVIGYSDLIGLMIKNKMKVIELSKLHYNYTPPASPFVNILLLLAKKLDKGN